LDIHNTLNVLVLVFMVLTVALVEVMLLLKASLMMVFLPLLPT
jgi:hypothetical protein